MVSAVLMEVDVIELQFDVLHFRVPDELRAYTGFAEMERVLRNAQMWLLMALRRYSAMLHILHPVILSPVVEDLNTELFHLYQEELLQDALRDISVYVHVVECNRRAWEEFISLAVALRRSIRFHNDACGFLFSYYTSCNSRWRRKWLRRASVLYFLKRVSINWILRSFIRVYNGRTTIGAVMSSRIRCRYAA